MGFNSGFKGLKGKGCERGKSWSQFTRCPSFWSDWEKSL